MTSPPKGVKLTSSVENFCSHQLIQSKLAIFLIMTKSIPFFQSNVTSWGALLSNPTFKSLDIPSFDCAEFVGVQLREWTNLNIQEAANKARAGGVDTNNINGLITEFQKGYRPTELPPIVMKIPNNTEETWDGYNRYNACYELGISNFPFLVYQLKEGWKNRIEDAYDLVSLSANNHTVAKRHTINDFILLGARHCKRNGNSLSKTQISKWVDSINNSFNVKQRSDIVDKIYQQTTIAVNILPFIHPKSAQSKVSEIVDTSSSTNPVVICAKDRTYIERGFLQIMKNYVENSIDVTDVVTYTKNCETAEEVAKQRQFAVDYLKKLDDLAVQYVVKRMSNQSSAYSIAGALPQLIGFEDPQSLVEIN